MPVRQHQSIGGAAEVVPVWSQSEVEVLLGRMRELVRERDRLKAGGAEAADVAASRCRVETRHAEMGRRGNTPSGSRGTDRDTTE